VVQVVCPSCLTANRVPGERLGEEPSCGKCHAPLLAARHDIRGIPTLIVFKAGREAGRISGALDKRSLVRWVEEHA
jgi:Thioredoxin